MHLTHEHREGKAEVVADRKSRLVILVLNPSHVIESGRVLGRQLISTGRSFADAVKIYFLFSPQSRDHQSTTLAVPFRTSPACRPRARKDAFSYG